jgi:hypothetical protein
MMAYDIDEIWDGELRFEDVRVVRVDSAGRTRSEYYSELADCQELHAPRVLRRSPDASTLPAADAPEPPPTP